MSDIGGFDLISRFALSSALVIFIGGAPRASSAPVDWVAAKAAMQTPRISAFASAQSNGLITIAPSQAGIVAELNIVPGQSITAGQVIARLGGPQITAATIQADTALMSAQAAQRAAETSLTAEEQKLQQRLSTSQLLAEAKSALAAATAQTTAAQASVDMLRQSATLRSPLAGVVQTVAVANGDVLAAGQTVATVQPSTGTWLKAVFYGSPSMNLSGAKAGLFAPADGGEPVPVTVRGALAMSQADGGVPVALVAMRPLAPGMFGTVTLDLPEQLVTLVPSEALILDKAQWWVMIHDAAGEHPAPVTPGPAQGYDTVVKSGVQPGDDVVAVNAYLLYHRGIAALYRPPD
jgi:RND family efflux transporter MFP subunit